MKHSTKIVLDTRKALSTGKYPVKIRVGFNVIKNRKLGYQYGYYPTGVEMFNEEFEKLYSSKSLKEKLDVLRKKLEAADSIIENNPYITASEFAFFYTGKGNYKTVQGLFEIMRIKAKANGQVSTWGLYGNTSNSLTNFMKWRAKKLGGETDGDLPIGQLNTEFLNDYEKWLLEEEKLSYNTVGIYGRNIRTMYNFAIENKIVKQDQYPFGRNRYVVPAASARKLALTEEQKNTLISFRSDNLKWQKALDFWTLSFFCFGLNFSDIIRLKNSNFHPDNSIRLYRTKTFKSKRIKKELEIPITDRVMEIVTKYGKFSLDPEAYVFNVISKEMTPFQQKARINDFIKHTNEALSEISEHLNLPKITTYTARHTFAYVMKIKQVPVSMVQEMMGHEDQKTTINYQGSFMIEEKRAAVKMLLG